MIKSLKLQNYRKFSEKGINFEPGINVIWGRNEAGKSTVMSALETLLFTDASTKAKNFYDYISSWGSGDGKKDIFLEAVLYNEKGEYLLTKDFASARQEIKSVNDNQTYEEGYKQVSDFLAHEFSIPSREVFEATSFVRQSEIAKLHFSRELRTALQRVMAVSPEGSNLEISVKELEKELQNLQLGLNRPSKTVGPLKATQDELGMVRQDLVQKREAWDKVLKAKETGGESGEKLHELTKKIDELETLIHNNKKYEEGKKQLADLEKQLNEISGEITQLKDYEHEIKKINAEVSSFRGFEENDPVKDTEKLQNLRQSVKLSQETLGELQALLAKSDKSEKLNYLQISKGREQIKNLLKYGAMISGLGVVMLVIGLAFVAILSYPGVFTLAIGLGLLVWALNKFINDGGYALVEGKGDETSKGLKKQIDDIRQKIENAKSDQHEIVGKYRLNDANEFFAIKARYNTLIQEKDRLIASYKALLGERSIDKFNADHTALFNRKKEIETNILTDEVKAADMTPSEYLRKRRELDMLLIEQKRLDKSSTRSEVMVEESQVKYEDIISLEEKEDMLMSRLENLQKRQKVLNYTIDSLKDVIKSTGQSASKLVSKEVERFLPKLTKERYKDLRLRDDYEIEIFSSERNDWIKPHIHLSQGTVDQIFLLARFALAKTVLGSEPKYLFLDDPFVTFDSERLSQMREILQDLAQNTQIFLFTHSEHYKDWGHLTELA